MTDFLALHRHATIGWDLDETLIGHPASAGMHAFIRANPSIRHVLITFRTAISHEAIWTDLAAVTGAVDASCFVAVETMDAATAAQFQRLRRHRLAGLLAGPDTAPEIAYLCWKGAMCARWGASVLIDDRTDQVERGCALHNIALIHPDTFLTG